MRAAMRCGGGLAMVDVKYQGKTLDFPLQGGDKIACLMNKVAHCTRPHSPEGASQCDSDCSAHVSAVTQLDMDLLCITGPENELLTRDVQVAMRHDVLNNPFWANAVWLQCEHDDTGVVTEMAPQHLPVYNPNDSHMVLHLKAVVWAKGLPIAVYDCTTPGTIDTALRTHFQPLAKALDSFWTLKRSVDHLHVDGPIKKRRRQRMWMLGPSSMLKAPYLERQSSPSQHVFPRRPWLWAALQSPEEPRTR